MNIDFDALFAGWLLGILTMMLAHRFDAWRDRLKSSRS